jgi:thiol-disulfide isomerase/thioredoxin
MAFTNFGKTRPAESAPGESPRELAAIADGSTWINSPGLSAPDLLGKVVLVDFWTYTCINWLRTLPYLRAWVEKYRDRISVIGVHTPEFPFEHNIDNVRRAVKLMHIDYPVVLDNDYSIWRAFKNQYWPALYLIDARGRIRHRHFGEGEYRQSELAIQRLLPASTEAGFVSVSGSGQEAAADWTNLRSAETYLGFGRSDTWSARDVSYAGGWAVGRNSARLSRSSGRIISRFHARDLHLVMGPSRPGSVRFRVTLDGQPPLTAHGSDVDEFGSGTATDPRLYQLIRQRGRITDRRFEIEFLDAGIDAYAFTFG